MPGDNCGQPDIAARRKTVVRAITGHLVFRDAANFVPADEPDAILIVLGHGSPSQIGETIARVKYTGVGFTHANHYTALHHQPELTSPVQIHRQHNTIGYFRKMGCRKRLKPFTIKAHQSSQCGDP